MEMFTSSDHMVILRSENKIIDFFMILAWASPLNIGLCPIVPSNASPPPPRSIHLLTVRTPRD